ncbi:MAG: cysteine desulfurase NifS, partial [Clostridia bacterium]
NEVFDEMKPYFSEIYGNASSLHGFGREAMAGVDKAREQVAKVLNCATSEVYFTSGGSESDNWAIRGIAKKKKAGHIITSKIEHPAVLNTLAELEKDGFAVTYLDVDHFGTVDVEQLKKAIRPDTILITIMAANNEVGTIQPIEEIGKIAKLHKIPFHTDAVQAMGVIDFDVKALNIDMLSISGHKFYAPKGIGVLYVRNGLGLGKFLTGGEQERGMRAGTTMTPQIVGLGKAIEMAYTNLPEHNAKLAKMRDYLIKRILTEIPYTTLNGHPTNRLPNNVNISYEYIEGESILMLLDLDGIAVSTGSACSSGSLKSSHVLLAMGVDIELAHGSIRMTLGDGTTMEDLDYVVEKLTKAVDRLRFMSPLFCENKGEYKNV